MGKYIFSQFVEVFAVFFKLLFDFLVSRVEILHFFAEFFPDVCINDSQTQTHGKTVALSAQLDFRRQYRDQIEQLQIADLVHLSFEN